LDALAVLSVRVAENGAAGERFEHTLFGVVVERKRVFLRLFCRLCFHSCCNDSFVYFCWSHSLHVFPSRCGVSFS
jgi:hypothetical protein